MSTFEQKYNKYKEKLAKFNTNEIMDSTELLDILENNELNNNDQAFNQFANNDKYCDKIMYADTYSLFVSNIGKYMQLKIKNKFIDIPVVIKNKNNYNTSSPGNFATELVNKTKYIYSNMSLSTEFIMLLYVRKLWNKGENPHLPLLCGYGSCQDGTVINRLITEKHGLDYDVNIVDNNKINIGFDIFFAQPSDVYNEQSNLATLYNFTKYISLNTHTNKIPAYQKNKFIDIDVTKLFDFITFSIIYTRNYLTENNIHTFDMSTNNIFIHWLNKSSYMGDKYIGDAEYIYYKINNKIYQFQTYGLMPKYGDMGVGIIKPKDDLMILTQCTNLEKTISHLPIMLDTNLQTCNELTFLTWIFKSEIYDNLILSKITKSYPVNTIYNQHINKSDISKFKSFDQLSSMFDIYKVDNIDTKKKYIVIG